MSTRPIILPLEFNISPYHAFLAATTRLNHITFQFKLTSVTFEMYTPNFVTFSIVTQ